MRLRRRRDEVEVDPAGLTARGGGVVAAVTDRELLDDARDLVAWLLAHPGFTEGHYGFWPIRVADGEVWERDDALTNWVKGADRATRFHALQEDTCWNLASGFEPPHADATAVVAPGALDRDRLELVRYEYLAPQSGWFVGGDRGERRPLFELVAARPELAEFLALEPGWSVRVDREGARVKKRDG